MDTISSSRRPRHALLPTLALAALVVCGGGNADAAVVAPPSSATQKLTSCLKAKGFSVPPTPAVRASAKYKGALRSCAKQAGPSTHGTNPNRAKYISCMAKHGIAISPASKTRPSRSSAAFKKASAACASLRTG